MSYWSVIPTVVRKSRTLTAEEKELYYEISDRVNAGGYCSATNTELAMALHVSEKTITSRLAALREKKYANVILNLHKHRRQIYLNIPGEPSEEQKPDEEKSRDKMKNFQESLKRTIVLGTIPFETLIERIRESPYLEELKDNAIQFALNADQIQFLAKFKKAMPQKPIDCQIACYPDIDYLNLIDQIEHSDFLMQSNNLSLKWCLEHSQDILSGKHRTYNKPYIERPGVNFSERNYTREEMNSLFQSLEEIDV